MTLLIVQFLHCQFAVKSGGHAAFKGASNIDSGITIDLKNLKQVTVSADRTFTKVGAGNHWADVYSRLDPLGLSVVGGRVADIGVGGLTLGGKLRPTCICYPMLGQGPNSENTYGFRKLCQAVYRFHELIRERVWTITFFRHSCTLFRSRDPVCLYHKSQ